MKSPPYVLDRLRREAVLLAIKEICIKHRWALIAAHVRTNHPHVVVEAGTDPETVLNAFKSHCSKRLNERHIDPNPVRRWIRHGSTKYLWTVESVESAIEYVLLKQGHPMEIYPSKARKGQD
jgi:REP element-mobilizing transposase RayT